MMPVQTTTDGITTVEWDSYIEVGYIAPDDKGVDVWVGSRVTVQKPYMAFGMTQPATVNWSALGATTPIDAANYAALIARAAAIASGINAK